MQKKKSCFICKLNSSLTKCLTLVLRVILFTALQVYFLNENDLPTCALLNNTEIVCGVILINLLIRRKVENETHLIRM